MMSSGFPFMTGQMWSAMSLMVTPGKEDDFTLWAFKILRPSYKYFLLESLTISLPLSC